MSELIWSSSLFGLTHPCRARPSVLSLLCGEKSAVAQEGQGSRKSWDEQKEGRDSKGI